MFALVIFVCDGLLDIKEENVNQTARFFRMAKDLSHGTSDGFCVIVRWDH